MVPARCRAIVTRTESKATRAKKAVPATTAAAPAFLGAAIPFADLAGYPLVMPGTRDGVRQQVLATAKRLALSLDVILDVSSVSMMKNMVARGDAAAVMPYGNVIDDIAAGRIVGRRLADPPLTRTLYLVRAMRRAPFTEEKALKRWRR
jgi:LysR family nitrogen assimilation transcriptional regulator